MRYLMILSFVASSLLSACSAQGPVRFNVDPALTPEQLARVVVPGPITVKSIDGQDVDSPSQEHGFYELHLSPGSHLIAFTYEKYWGDGTSGIYLKSALTAVEANFIAGKVYTLTYQIPKNQDEAWTLSNNFSARLIEPTTGLEVASYRTDDINRLQTQNAAGQKDSQPAQSIETAQKSKDVILDADAAVHEDPVKRLKYWWLMADEKERQTFRDWMKSATETFAPETPVIK